MGVLKKWQHPSTATWAAQNTLDRLTSCSPDAGRQAVQIVSSRLPIKACGKPSLVLQGDKQLREAMDVILECAFGSIPYTDSTCVPSSSTCVDVALRESAYNPLHPQHQLQQQDETLYVAFQQHIQIKVGVQLQLAGPSASSVCPGGVQLCIPAMLEAQQLPASAAAAAGLGAVCGHSSNPVWN